MTLPHDLQAETAYLGLLILQPHHISEARNVVNPADFYNPAHAAVCDAIYELHNTGQTIDPFTVHALTGNNGPTRNDLVIWQSEAPATWLTTADLIVHLADRRRIITACQTTIASGAPDPTNARDNLIAELQDVTGGRHAGPINGLNPWTQILDDNVEPPPWVIPGMIRKGHRAMVVAAEGVGKTVMLRQLCITASAGLHPFAKAGNFRKPIPPVRTLVVDLENPHDQVVSVGRLINTAITKEGATLTADNAHVIERPAGLDLRSRRGLQQLEQAIAQTHPDLVAIGPLYKAYRVNKGENDEQAAAHVQQVLDDLRTRYDFALLLEHHAPKATTISGGRELSPYGSSLWLRWPELGRGLRMDPNNTQLAVDKWRGDRVQVNWPSRIYRGPKGGWPFEADYSPNTNHEDF